MKLVHYGIWDWCIVGCVQQVYTGKIHILGTNQYIHGWKLSFCGITWNIWGFMSSCTYLTFSIFAEDYKLSYRSEPHLTYIHKSLCFSFLNICSLKLDFKYFNIFCKAFYAVLLIHFQYNDDYCNRNLSVCYSQREKWVLETSHFNNNFESPKDIGRLTNFCIVQNDQIYGLHCSDIVRNESLFSISSIINQIAIVLRFQ